jgi:hypothetical protein
MEYYDIHLRGKPYRFLKPVRFGIVTKVQFKKVEIKKTTSIEAAFLLINLTINLIFPVV